MSQNPGNINNLELYNLSRSIGSKAISIVDESATVDTPTSKNDIDMSVVAGKYTSAKSQHDYWPFDSATDLVEIVLEETTVSGSPDELQEFSSTISDRLVETDSDTESESGDSATHQQEETKETEETEDTQQNEQPTQSVGTSVEQTADVDDSVEEETDTESPSDSVDSNTESQSGDNLPPTEVSEVASEGGITMHVAADLYYHLLGDGEKTVSDLEEEYSTVFPDESVILTEFFNTSGSTKERIREVESWIDQWYDDEDQVSRANDYNRRGMMLSSD